MMQVISNLMMNSIYAMQTGGIWSISVEDAANIPDGIVLTIQDNGVGIAEADLPRVFEDLLHDAQHRGHRNRPVCGKAVY